MIKTHFFVFFFLVPFLCGFIPLYCSAIKYRKKNGGKFKRVKKIVTHSVQHKNNENCNTVNTVNSFLHKLNQLFLYLQQTRVMLQ